MRTPGLARAVFRVLSSPMFTEFLVTFFQFPLIVFHDSRKSLFY